MDEDDKIQEEDFKKWKKDRVTRAILNAIEDTQSGLKDALLNSELLLSVGSEKKAAYLAGQIDALQLVQNVRYEDLDREE